MTISISIAGDLFISDSSRNDVSMGERIKSLFLNSDLSIVNLEAPVTNKWSTSQMIQKDGPHLRMSEWVLEFINNSGINSVSLANNHILDYGPEGLLSTIDLCERYELRYVGAGSCASAAAAPLIYETKGKKIAFIAVCENEWSVATNSLSGANGFDLMDCHSSIMRLKSECDVIVAIVHGGNEHYNLPSPRVKKTMRFLVDIGADAVVMHHSHCVSGMEVYNGNPIFYGLGNFFFTSQGKSDGWYRGLVVNLLISEEGALSWQTNFVEVTGARSTVELVSVERESELRELFNTISSIISDDQALSKEWADFVEKSSPFYYQVLSPINLVPTSKLRGMFRRLGLFKYIFPRRHLVHLINYITCESHLDVSRAVLSNKLKG